MNSPRLTTIRKGPVYYHRNENRFFQVRSDIKKDPLVCSDYCHFYEDATTTTTNVNLPRSILERSILIETPEDHPDICHNSGIGWKVIEGAHKEKDSTKES